jgi:excisionase family DNA binding protein
MMENDENLMTVREVAQYLNLEKQTIYNWLRIGKLNGWRLVGRMWRFKRSEIEEWIRRGNNAERQDIETGE